MRLPTLLILLLAATAAARAYEFKLYATFTEDTRVELSDGAVWMMDKGDVFPVEAYKNMQKNIVLRLAGATFMTDTPRVRILKPEEVPAGVETYRKNVRAYLDSTSEKIVKQMKPGTGTKTEAKPKPEADKKPDAEKAPGPEKKP